MAARGTGLSAGKPVRMRGHRAHCGRTCGSACFRRGQLRERPAACGGANTHPVLHQVDDGGTLSGLWRHAQPGAVVRWRVRGRIRAAPVRPLDWPLAHWPNRAAVVPDSVRRVCLAHMAGGRRVFLRHVCRRHVSAHSGVLRSGVIHKGAHCSGGALGLWACGSALSAPFPAAPDWKAARCRGAPPYWTRRASARETRVPAQYARSSSAP